MSDLLKSHERYRLMGVSAMSWATVVRWERGEKIKESTKRTLDKAARRLGLPVPEKPKS